MVYDASNKNQIGEALEESEDDCVCFVKHPHEMDSISSNKSSTHDCIIGTGAIALISFNNKQCQTLRRQLRL